MDHKNEAATTHEVSSNGSPPRKGGIMNTLYPPGPKPGVGGRVKNHCRRFWWCDLLVVAIIALIIVLPIIFVAIPKKAQSDINKSTLEVTAQEVTDPTPEKVHLKLVSKAKSSSSFHPTIEAFRGGLHLKDKEPFFYVDIPSAKANAEFDIIIEQDVPIENMDGFKEYTKVALGSETFDVYLDGKTKIKQSGLQPISVDYNKKVTLKGLNSLKGLQITDVKILSGQTGEDAVLEDGSNLIGNVYIPNPSIMTLALGNLTMNLAVDGKSIGTSLIPNLTLRPGNNTIPMQSHVDQLGLVSVIMTKYKNGVIPLEITGNSSVYNGQHLEYYEEAVQANKIMLDLDAGPALREAGIDITL